MLLFGLLFISGVSAQNQGQVLVGGSDSKHTVLSSVEIFPRPPSNTCTIPDLPRPRIYHSLSLLPVGLVVCGGIDDVGDSLDSCLSWVAGNDSWTPLYKMSVARDTHTAWTPPSLPNSIMLLGGWDDEEELNAEILPGGETFELEHYWANSCGIPDKNTIVMTGGMGHNHVTRYNTSGFVEELPKLPENRWGHACATLPASEAFVVAGGHQGQTNTLSSSVLILVSGATVWTPLVSLPRALNAARASVVRGKIRVTGGFTLTGNFGDGYSPRSEVLEYHPNGWLKVGDLQEARNGHAVLSIGTQEPPCLAEEARKEMEEDRENRWLPYIMDLVTSVTMKNAIMAWWYANE